MIRALSSGGIVAVAAMSASTASAVGIAPAPRPGSATAYISPITGPTVVARGFDPPDTPFGAGHRGVDLVVAVPGVVHASGSGVIAFAGDVAGRGVVVISHADGITTEYEPVRPILASGTRVKAGTVIGYVVGRHGECAVNRCLHWGAQRGSAYFDPMTLLRPLGPVRLVPWPS